MRVLRFVGTIATLAMASTSTHYVHSASAEPAPEEIPADVLEVSASDKSDTALQPVAKHFGVTVDEMRRQIQVQEDLDHVDLAARDTNFVDIYTVPGPEMKLRYLTLGDSLPPGAAKALSDLVEPESIEVVTVPLSREEMGAAGAIVGEALRGTPVDTSLDLESGSVHVYSTTRIGEGLTSAIAKQFEGPRAARVDFHIVDEIAEPAIGGGKPIGGCTAGFVVQMDGITGLQISTAGHCSNSMSYNGYSTTLYDERYYNTWDYQVHDSSSLTFTRTFWNSYEWTPVTSKKNYFNMNMNDVVCKYGKTTSLTCGWIVDLEYAPSYVPQAVNNFVVVNDDVDFTDPGDSGGPVFYNEKAWGLVSGHWSSNNKGIFMAQSWMNDVGVHVAVQ